jgi:PAS domain S-box-containing protein
MSFPNSDDSQTLIRSNARIETLEQKARDLARSVETVRQQTLAQSSERIESLEQKARDLARFVETTRQQTLLQADKKTQALEQKARDLADFVESLRSRTRLQSETEIEALGQQARDLALSVELVRKETRVQSETEIEALGQQARDLALFVEAGRQKTRLQSETEIAALGLQVRNLAVSVDTVRAETDLRSIESSRLTPDEAKGITRSSKRGLVEWAAPYCFALLCVAVVAAVRGLVDPMLGERYAYTLFIIPALLMANYYGWKPASFALVAGMMATNYFFMKPRFSFLVEDLNNLIGMFFYMAAGATGIVLVASGHSAQRKADAIKDLKQQANSLALSVEISRIETLMESDRAIRKLNEELEQRVVERTRQLEAANTGLEREASERERVEKEKQKIQEELADFFENATEGLRWLDADGKILWANRAELAMLGVTREQYIGHDITEFYVDRGVALGKMRRLRHGEWLHDFQAELRCRDGSIKTVLIDSSVLWQDGQFVHTRDFTRDITGRKQAEEALAEHQKELERTNRELERKNERLSQLYQTAQRFVDDVSHEFRTPLTVIKGYTELVIQGVAGPANKQQLEFLGYVLDRTRDLTQMVDDLLDSSKLRAGTLRVDRRPHQAVELFARVRSVLLAKAAVNKIELVEKFDGLLPEVFADGEKVGRVIMNLAVNAIKFSPEGGRVTLWAKPVADGGIEIGVTDGGAGIAPENLELIFQRFKQVGDGHGENTKGFGLGLNIARELVALNLGEIRVTSILGKGSTFAFTLPANDVYAVLHRYLIYLDALATTDNSFSLLRVANAPTGPVSEELREFIASAVRPTELVLDAPDGNSLFVIGCTTDPQGWIRSLGESALGGNIAMASGMPQEPGPMRIECLGSWAYPEAKSDAILRSIAELCGEPTHA